MLPPLRSKNSISQYGITGFGGLNPSFSQRINEFTDTKNMSSKLYPAVSSEKALSTISTTDKIIDCALFYDKLYTIERTNDISGDIYLCSDDKSTVISSFSEDDAPKKHNIQFMKNSVFVSPENVIYHTDTDTVQKGNLFYESYYEKAEEKFKNEYNTEKDMPDLSGFWRCAELKHNSINFKKVSHVFSSKSYDFYYASLPNDFKVDDIITVKMEFRVENSSQNPNYSDYKKKLKNGITLRIKSIENLKHSSPTGTLDEIVSVTFDDYAIDMGGFSEVFVTNLTIEKTIPDFVDICSFENRMWGVSKNELCSSRLGDCGEWNDFTVDAYGTVPSSCFKTEVESDGEFTAITSFNGNVIAFKEDCIYKIYGNEPDEYSLNRINCPGVKKGCHKTLATVGGTLYYMSKNGICAFNGSSFNIVSQNLDIFKCDGVCAAGDGRFYTIKLEGETGAKMYVFDTSYGIWHIDECPAELVDITQTDGEILYVCKTEIMQRGNSYYDDWFFTLSLGKKEFASKHICSVFIRYDLEEEGSFKIVLKNKHSSYTLATLAGEAKNKMHLISIPVSCSEDADLIFEGKGKFVLSSLTIRYKETGINV